MGDLMSLPALKDLFARHRARATGLWRLGQDPHRTVFMEAGDIVFAASTHPLDRLTHLLVERGRITQAQLDYAMANLNPAMSIGKNLIEMGFITQRDLLDVARAQVERVVWASIANTEQEPVFQAKDLDATTVRLPFDTPAMLLTGVLSLTDRERVLEELGPLNQVVVLEGRRHQELTLPPDLARLPGLLDGSRTLMELSRESGVDPFRLGSFVLFLREMGWARLHELPPLDRRALELALDPAAPVITPTLPEPEAAPQPSLFSEIHASQHPTTNLEHLSEALDQLGPEDEVEELPRTVPEPPDPDPEPPEPEPALPIHHEAIGSTEHAPAEPPPPGADTPPRSRRPLVVLAILAVLVGGLWAGIRRLSRPRPKAQTSPVMAVPTPAMKPPPPSPEAAKPVPAPEPENKPVPPPQPVPSPQPALPPPAVTHQPEAPSVPSKADRLQTILQGDWKKAVSQGSLHAKSLQGRWSLRLEIACQGSTIQHAADLLKGRDPDLFLIPMTMRDGRTCYQIFFGSFGSEAAAKEAAKKLPAPFLAEGNRPKPFRVAQIPARQ
jgi:septal ring-binding cell division protein DamX